MKRMNWDSDRMRRSRDLDGLSWINRESDGDSSGSVGICIGNG